GVLGGVVEGAARERESPAHRGEVHDAAPALAAHAGENELRQPDEAEDVGLELAAHLGHRHLLEGALLAVAGIVDQHADRALGALDRLDRGAHRGFVAHVECERPAAAAPERAYRLRPPRRRRDRPAARRETRRARPPAVSTAATSPSASRTRPPKASSRRSAPRARSTSAKNASTASGPRSMARRTSRHITLPEPSQIELSGTSR